LPASSGSKNKPSEKAGGKQSVAARGSISQSFQKYLYGILGYHSGAEKQKTAIF
jgi:hypothetical protein